MLQPFSHAALCFGEGKGERCFCARPDSRHLDSSSCISLVDARLLFTHQPRRFLRFFPLPPSIHLHIRMCILHGDSAVRHLLRKKGEGRHQPDKRGKSDDNAHGSPPQRFHLHGLSFFHLSGLPLSLSLCMYAACGRPRVQCVSVFIGATPELAPRRLPPFFSRTLTGSCSPVRSRNDVFLFSVHACVCAFERTHRDTQPHNKKKKRSAKRGTRKHHHHHHHGVP